MDEIADAVGWLRRICGMFGEAQDALVRKEDESTESDLCLVDQLHSAAIEVFLRRLSVVALLIRNRNALEADALVRGMLELAVTVTWVGQSEDRALRVRAKGAKQSKLMYERVSEHVDEIEVSEDELERVRALVDDVDKQLPNTFDIFSECNLLSIYAETYTRMCSPSHVDWWHLEKVVYEPEGNIKGTTRGVMQASVVMLEAMDWFPDGRAMAEELRRGMEPPESTQLEAVSPAPPT